MFSQDLYKFTMMNAVLKNFNTGHTCTFRFKSRGPEKLGILADTIRNRFTIGGKAIFPVHFSKESVKYLNEKCFLDKDVLDYAAGMDFKSIQFDCRNVNGDLEIDVSGLWEEVTLFEIPVLSAVQEEWSRINGWLDLPELYRAGLRRMRTKIADFNRCREINFSIIEMGTRRAFSNRWLCLVIRELAKNLKSFAGTSNVGMAMALGVPCKGTMAHEYLQMGQVLAPNLKETNCFMLNAWRKAHGDRYGIALSDCLTSDVFMREFDYELAKAFVGTRQDSGDPYAYGEKIRNHYEKLGIDPLTKRVCFSDSLNADKAMNLLGYFTDVFQGVDFGIGTFFSHDLGVEPLKIVMKMIEFDGNPVIKISDDAGKTMGANSDYEKHVRKELGINA